MNRIHAIIRIIILAGCCLGLFTTIAPGAVAQTELYRDSFAAGSGKGWTLQPPINALGPIPVNGAWKPDNGSLVATGTAAPWTIQTTGDASWTDYRLSVQVTIRKQAPVTTIPISTAEYDRYLPREDFPPLAQHSGQYRYRYFAGEFDWGSDAAVYFRYKDRGDCYRVQFSTEYQELILWHSVGGYLQVVPCELAINRPYKLEIQTQGAHLQISLDGQKKIDYWHECLPTLQGGIGLASYRATVAFKSLQVDALEPAAEQMPEHQAVFTTRKWRGFYWIFDNNEPIVNLEKNQWQGADDNTRNNLFFNFVKLRPGYRPLYNTFVGVIKDGGQTTGLEGGMETLRIEGKGQDTLILYFNTITVDKKLRAYYRDVITYNPTRKVYCHDISTIVEFPVAQTITSLEFCDPLTFNNLPPGRSVKYPWLASNDDWGIFPGEDGMMYRHPISTGLHLGQGWYTKTPPAFWMVYPGRAVCPVWEFIEPNAKTFLEVCHWGHDYHSRLRFEQGYTFKAGDRFTLRYTLTGYTTEEGEKLFKQSTLNPLHLDLANKRRDELFMIVPDPYAFPVCEPAGTTFDILQSSRDPFNGWYFTGDYTIDKTIGRTDKSSLRLDGPATTTASIYHNMLDIYAKKYLCTVWIKTKGVRGQGPKVTLKYDFEPKPTQSITTGLTGDNDWQEISFISTVPTTHDSSAFIVALDGAGTVWIDDFSLRPLNEGEKVTEKIPAPKTATAEKPSADYLLYLPCTEGEGMSCYDASGHGNSAKLYGATWINLGQRSAVYLDNGAYALVPALSPELVPPTNGIYPHAGLTLDAWICPSRGKGGGTLIGFSDSPRLFLEPSGVDRFILNFSVNCSGKWEQVTSPPSLAAGYWAHVAAVMDATGVIRLYINGQPVAEKTVSPKFKYSAYEPMISIGTLGKHTGSPYSGGIAEIRWWSRAATAAEIQATASQTK